MKKRMILAALLLCMLISLLPAAAFAAEGDKSGTCGEGITWTLEGYTLTITGSGEMADGCPWAEHMDHIDTVIISDGITKIGAEAFKDHIWIKYVEFGQDVREIGDKAFYGCKRITLLHLPASFRIFGAQSFRNCESLTRVYCDGPMPRFNDSCLWTGSYISVFFPTNNPWPFEHTSTLISNYGGNMGIFMGNYEEAYAVETEPAETEETEPTQAPETEATEAPTEAVAIVVAETVPQTVETTVPETLAEETTVPPTTVAQTLAPTEAPTEAETEPVENSLVLEFTEETVPEEKPVKKSGGSWIAIVMIAGVITFLLAGAMIFRGSRRNRY